MAGLELAQRRRALADQVVQVHELAVRPLAGTVLAQAAQAVRDRILATLTDRAAPALTSLFGVGDDCAAELLLVVGDNPERIHSEAALAKLRGACPVPASSRKPPGIASIEAATAKPTPPRTASSSSV